MKLEKWMLLSAMVLGLGLAQAEAHEGQPHAKSKAKSQGHASMSRARDVVGTGACESCPGRSAELGSPMGPDFGGNPTRSSANAYENTGQEPKYRDGHRVARDLKTERPYGEEMEAEEEDPSMMESESESDWNKPQPVITD